MITTAGFLGGPGPVGEPATFARGEDDVLRYKAWFHSGSAGWQLRSKLAYHFKETWKNALAEYPKLMFVSRPKALEARWKALIS